MLLNVIRYKKFILIIKNMTLIYSKCMIVMSRSYTEKIYWGHIGLSFDFPYQKIGQTGNLSAHYMISIFYSGSGTAFSNLTVPDSVLCFLPG
jgi:hypothetical protein